MPNVRQETGRGFSANGINISEMNNTNAEMVLFEQMIPAGAMGVAKRLDFYLNGRITTSLVNPAVTIRVKLGGQVLTVINGATLLVSQNNAPFLIEGRIKNLSQAAQEVYAKISSTANGLLSGPPFAAASWTVDTAQDQMFQITAQFGLSLTGGTLRVKDADLECS